MQFQILTQQFATRIAVDDRERNSRVKTALKRKGTVDISIRRLPPGDYQVDDTLLVERKTLANFALSVRDGRLFPQVSRLARQNAMGACLILEGTPDQYPVPATPKHVSGRAYLRDPRLRPASAAVSATPEVINSLTISIHISRNMNSKVADILVSILLNRPPGR